MSRFIGMIDFNVNQEPCTKCGQCSSDCPARIITMEGGYPAITQEFGTVWDGLAKYVISEMPPEYKSRSGIPEDHVIGYAMGSGKVCRVLFPEQHDTTPLESIL